MSGRAADQLPLLGMARYLVIAESEEVALETARRAYPIWRKSFTALWHMHGKEPSIYYSETFDGIKETGQGIAGTPTQVRDEIIRQCERSDINYFVCRFAFGDLTFEESNRSIELFAEHVMPEVSSIS